MQIKVVQNAPDSFTWPMHSSKQKNTVMLWCAQEFVHPIFLLKATDPITNIHILNPLDGEDFLKWVLWWAVNVDYL